VSRDLPTCGCGKKEAPVCHCPVPPTLKKLKPSDQLNRAICRTLPAMACFGLASSARTGIVLGLLALAGLLAVAIGAVGLASPVHASTDYALGTFIGNVIVGTLCVIAFSLGVVGEVKRQTSYWFGFLVLSLFALVGEAVVAVLSIISYVYFTNDPYGFAYVVWFDMTAQQGLSFEQSHNCSGFDGCRDAVVNMIRSTDIAAIAVSWFVVCVLAFEVVQTCFATHDSQSKRRRASLANPSNGIKSAAPMSRARANSTMSSLGNSSLPHSLSDPSASISTYGVASLALRMPTEDSFDPSYAHHPGKHSVTKTSSGGIPVSKGPSGSIPITNVHTPKRTRTRTASTTLPVGTSALPSGNIAGYSLSSGTLRSGTLHSGTLPAGMNSTSTSGVLPSGSIPSGTIPVGIDLDAYMAPGASADLDWIYTGQPPVLGELPEEPSHDEQEEECITWGSSESMTRQAEELVARANSGGLRS